MSWHNIHQGPYVIRPNDLPPDHDIGQGEDASFDPYFPSLDLPCAPFYPPLCQNYSVSQCNIGEGNAYDSGVVDYAYNHQIELPRHLVNDQSASPPSVPQWQEDTERPEWVLSMRGTDGITDTVISLVPSQDAAQFLLELHGSGVKTWTLSCGEDNHKVPAPSPEKDFTVPSSSKGDGSSSRTASIGDRTELGSRAVPSGGMSDVNHTDTVVSCQDRYDRSDVDDIIAALPDVINKVLKNWSGDKRELVLHQTLLTLGTDVNGVLACEPSLLPAFLAQLCGPNGRLCDVERHGPQHGVTRVSCKMCSVVFLKRNPVEKYAHHIITHHWNIHPFKCAYCEHRTGRRQDCRRHQHKCNSMWIEDR